jgi:hypothetical protein
VGKKFCRSLKKSLWYGVCDIGAELNPFRRRVAEGDSRSEIGGGGGEAGEQHSVILKNVGVNLQAAEPPRTDGGLLKADLTTEDTESTEGAAGVRLAGQAGAEFSNPSTSELAGPSENSSRTGFAGDPASERHSVILKNVGINPDGAAGDSGLVTRNQLPAQAPKALLHSPPVTRHSLLRRLRLRTGSMR